MQITVTQLPKSRIKLHVEVSSERMGRYIDDAYQQLAQQIDIPGFRKGRAPKMFVKERVGDARILSTALDHALPQTYHEAITREGYIPVAEPEIHVKTVGENDALVYEADVDVLPKVATGPYQSVRVDKQKFAVPTIQDSELDEVITRVRRSAAVPQVVLRAAQKGDVVEVTYEGRVDGVVQSSLQSKNHPIILGEAMVIPTFEDQLIGMATGEEKDFTIQVPGANERTQTVNFHAKIDKISELVLPEFDDALAKKFGKETVQEVRDAIVEDLTVEKAQDQQHKLEVAVLEAVVGQATIDLPDSLINREIERRVEVLQEQLKPVGKSLDDWLKNQKKDLAAFKAELRPAAEQSVKTGLVLRAIADAEQLLKPGQEATNEALQKVVTFLVDHATA